MLHFKNPIIHNQHSDGREIGMQYVLN